MISISFSRITNHKAEGQLLNYYYSLDATDMSQFYADKFNIHTKLL